MAPQRSAVALMLLQQRELGHQQLQADPHADAWAKAALWALIVLSLLGLGIVAAFVFLDIDYITPDYNIKFLVVRPMASCLSSIAWA